MRRFFYLILFSLTYFSFNSYASETILACNVSGRYLSTFEDRALPSAQVTVEINSSKESLVIIVEGGDDYIASAGTINNQRTKLLSNYSDSNKYDITSIFYPSSGNIRSITTKININRLTGQLSVSSRSDFHNNSVFVERSFSGLCNKSTNRKF